MDYVYFPCDWKTRWKEFYNDVTNYQRQGKNKHDDSVDCLTGVCESINKNQVKLRFI